MKNNKFIFLGISLLLLGAISAGCPARTDNQCTNPKEYFEVLSPVFGTFINILDTQTGQSFGGVTDSLLQNATVIDEMNNPNRYHYQFTFNFSTSFFSVAATEKPKEKPSIFRKDFSLFPKAYAVLIVGPFDPCAQLAGSKGTPDRISSFEIYDDVDFDATHKANQSLNDYFTHQEFFNVNTVVGFNSWVSNVLTQTPHNVAFNNSIYAQSHQIELTQLPYKNTIHHLLFRVTFQDGRSFTGSIGKIYVK